ncbi:MAG: acyl-CoA dehydrogenase family protein, partial [Dehalococcoidia bacterium]
MVMTATNLTEEEKLIVGQIRRFVEREVMPVASELEHGNEYPQALIDQMRQMGLFACVIPSEYGGLGLNFTTYAAIVEELSRGWMSLGGILNTHAIVSYMLTAYGTEEQRQRFLPAMATGEVRCGLTITEPDAGSDVQAIQTTVRHDGDGYLLNGTKMFVSNGRHGRLFAVLCKTDARAQPPHRGMSVLLMEKEGTPGLTVGREIEKLGYKGIDTTEFVFQDTRVPERNLLGGVEGQGFA